MFLILRKAQLGIQITNSDFEWLAENRLFKTIEIISLQQYQMEDFKRLEVEFLHLRPKYKIPDDLYFPIDSPIYSILGKLESGDSLIDSEIKLLNSHNLTETVSLIQDILNFSTLKSIYKVPKYVQYFPENPLYAILKKLDKREPLYDLEADWLLENDFEETLEICWQQENERKSIVEFAELKEKYRIDSFSNTSTNHPLYSILKKLKKKEELEDIECEWLEIQKLTQLIEIDRKRKNVKLFRELKLKYQATQYKSSDPSSNLFLILRNLEFKITESNIQWLINEKLIETAEIATRIHFKILKIKYKIVGELAADPFYEIMLKLEREERLNPKQVIQLIEENRLFQYGKIAITHYRLEALFYEKEYKQTGNKWSLASASSNWRKADDPKNALKSTANLSCHKIQELRLKAALLVTRGAAFRDCEQLDSAESHATQAIECQPGSHQPYTLMGAICYDRSKYLEGDKWFKMASERGAGNEDDQIQKIIKMIKGKDKCKEIVEYLLNKDPVRYSWANSYLSRP